MSLQPRIKFDHPDLPTGQEQGDYWGSPAFMQGFRPLVNAARAPLGLNPLRGKFRFLDAMISPFLHLMETTTVSYPLISISDEYAFLSNMISRDYHWQ